MMSYDCFHAKAGLSVLSPHVMRAYILKRVPVHKPVDLSVGYMEQDLLFLVFIKDLQTGNDLMFLEKASTSQLLRNP